MSSVDIIGSLLDIGLTGASAINSGADQIVSIGGGGSKEGEADFRIRQLEDDVGSLKLINAALIELLVEKNQFSLVELKSKTLEVDARDGKVDGKISRVISKCPKCGKTLMRGKVKCSYCT